MFAVRRSDTRGTADFGWLRSRHTFSFGHYFDPAHMGHGPLRVLNEDRVQPGSGFDTHGHRDMEIISCVLSGALKHEDSLGNGAVIRPGDVQRMSAGTGVRHSEFNASDENEVHFLQIWIEPERSGLKPEYEQRTFSRDDKLNRLRLVVSRTGRDGSVVIHRDVDLYAAVLDPPVAVSHRLGVGRSGWLQVAAGRVIVNGETLAQGDGVGVAGPLDIEVRAKEASEILLFDMV